MPTLIANITGAQQKELVDRARQAAEQAYVPYSGFRVGAALLLENGAIVTAANVENASYGLSLCAERSAVVCAVAEYGPTVRIAALAVINLNDAPSPPCGACRQVLAEFMAPGAPLLFPFNGTVQSKTLGELFPLGFDLTHE